MDTPEAADAYANADFAEVNRRFVQDVAAFAGSARRVLDLGCGPGDIPILLSQAIECERVVALDAAWPMLAWAKSRVDSMDRITLAQADAKRLPFRDATFPLTVSNSILHHVADPIAFWREAARVTTSGGRIFMRDLSRPASRAEAQRLVDEHSGDESEALRGEFYRSLCAAYTVEEVREQLTTAGLANLTVRATSDRHLDIVGVIP